MQPRHPPPPADPLKRAVMMSILALAWVGSDAGWMVMEWRGLSSPVLRGVFGLNAVFHPVMLAIVWRRWVPMRWVDLSCLLFAAGVCAACMALRLYSPGLGASIDIQPLYLWIPVIYVFAFTLVSHRASLKLSLAILALFVAISVPYLAATVDRPLANFTIQLHVVSAVLIAALHFFSSWQHRFNVARLSVDELARLANTDELTRLANRRRMAEAIDFELVRYARYAHVFSIIMIDIDHFKAVNDRFGHGTGDQALMALAARSREMLRDVDTLGRWGGEEFVVILPETPFEESLQKAAALCRHVAAEPLVGEWPLTISCGVATVKTGESAADLLKRADEALYAAKRLGRNRAEGAADEQAQAESMVESWA